MFQKTGITVSLFHDSGGNTSMCVVYSPPEKKTIELAKQLIHHSSDKKD